MNVVKIQNKVLDWIINHEVEFGLSATGKISTMLALDTYKKIIPEYMNKIDKSKIKAVIDHANMKFSGDLIQLLCNWSIVQKYVEDAELTKSKITKTLETYFIDDDNKMDTIDQLQCFVFLHLNDDIINKMVDDALLELANIKFWKYKLVKNPLYCRKIHNSFHYASPYVLLYHLSKIQAKMPLLPSHAESILKTIILDGYQNTTHLNMLDFSLLLAATPQMYQDLIMQNYSLFLSKLEQENLCNLPFYYDNIQYGGFIEAKTHIAAIIWEALNTSGKFVWEPFVEKKILEKTSTNQNNYLETMDLHHYPRTCRMKMKEHCMAPYLDEGDEIIVSYDFESTSINDILVFKHYDGRAMAHRVIDIIMDENKVAFITAADNGGLWGYPVFKRDIIGKVVNIIKHE